MTSARSAEASRRRFNDLVDSGAYGSGFAHPKAARDFVATVVQDIVGEIEPSARSFKVLDAGCGSGAWLGVLYTLAGGRESGEERRLALYGFDIADRMVETAKEDLAGLACPVRLQRGDILDPASYSFADVASGYDLVFAYDVVQQVARKRQFEAVTRLVDAVRPGGCAVVFDHERWSRYGLRMAVRKFITANTGLPLVPRYFCAASYPPLITFARRLSARSDISTRLVVEGHPRKRALVLRRAPETA